MGISDETIIQITLSDSKKGLLQGNHDAKVSVIDHSTNKTHWASRQTIYFSDGFAEIKLGPIDSFHTIKLPRVVLEIENNYLDFPIYPALFSLYSKSTGQLSDENALFVSNSNLGIGTKTPSEKVSIQGNLKFLGDNDFIQFSNGQKLYGTLLSSMTNTLSLNSVSLATVSNHITAMIASINTLQVSSGASPINVNTSLNNALLKIDSNGTIGPLNNFYIEDTNHYFLRTTNKTLSPTKIGTDFIISQDELMLGSVGQLSLKSSTLTSPTSAEGRIQYYLGNYYMYFNNQWRQLAATDHDYSLVKLKTSSLSSLSTGNLQGALAFDGTNYYVWKDAWKKINDYDFSGLSTSSSATNFLMIDANGSPFKSQIAPNKALLFNATGLEINDQYLTNNSITYWNNNQFRSVTYGSGLDFSNGMLALKAPIFINNTSVGIGVDPTETLDVNGALRLRTQSLQSLSNVSAGSIVFDGTNFKGWDGSNWKSLSQVTDVITSNAYWTYNNHLIASPNGNVGIKVANPQATLDINGNLRIRSIPSKQAETQFIVSDADGNLFKRSVQLSDFLSSSSQFKLNGSSLELTSMNASNNDILVFSNNNWSPKEITTDDHLEFSNFKFSLSTQNVTSGDILLFSNGAWKKTSLISELNFSSQLASLNEFLIWNGSNWVPGSLTGTNGITISNNSIGLDANLNWSNNKFTIGASSAADLQVNRLSSSLSSPVKVVDASNKVLLDINSAGQLSIGFDGAHNGYSIASQGFNLFSHSLSRYQAAVGTTNIGSSEFGPTLLVHSVPFDNPSSTRSIIEVLSISGQPRFEVQEGGNVGIQTGNPNATLDINGYAKLKKYTSEPTVCNLSKDGAIALTSQYKLCACNGSSWVQTADGTSDCTWQ